MAKNNLGLIHIYCGDGKGKTTCSVGLTVRAVGFGLKVLFMQFLKDGSSNELKVLKTLDNLEVVGTKPIKKFTFQMTEDEKRITREENAEQFLAVAERVRNEDFNMLVIDECLGSIEAGVLEEKIILDFLKTKPEHLEVVMTGRVPSDEMIEIADYVSRIDKVKHPYDQGIPARKGIEK
ncbi:MAG: cob(I)yrinic acid a,c-diamide adenosyltransferase [Peptostreptococcaceae bacterium]|nr:cob(I)yrinic acid a,c-diamide adenosyltransferase [Peptostreptococcaceae bacterium]MDY5738915.1 cob(I)yrinic acid a,c-diamide adenosyltransferase [Anaerovoracaceae bacterium]SFE40653.1 cob(I)alamin adenosyltransferase [Peptostreptococcaceae bacterium pGA-8]